MRSLPIFVKLAGKRVVVTGGGTPAARRCEIALRCGADVTVFAPELGGDFAGLEDDPKLAHVARALEESDVAGAQIVFVATEEETADRRDYETVRRAGSGALVNVADRPDMCDFTMASILDRSPLVVAIGTDGASPIFGRMLKARLETEIPAAYGRLVEFAGARREVLERVLPGAADRRRFWERMLEGPIAEMVLAGQEDAAARAFDDEIGEFAKGAGPGQVGEVYLVGAGPGDPDLLTFKALRLMQRCDVVLYDRLVSEDIMNLVRRDAERIYVGKQRNNHAMPQEQISALLVKLAQQGKRVLRIKGGDPFIFGRGGEEIEMLAAHGIPFQVVPGITAAAGCAAYAGIPLTHRDHAQSCLFVTGHGKEGHVDVDWNAMIQPHQTVAVYMGLSQLDSLMGEFIARGASPDLPAAVVDNGTKANQRVVTGTLATLPDKVRDAGLRGPTIIIIGSVVTLHDKLDWFGDGPNHNRTTAGEAAA